MKRGILANAAAITATGLVVGALGAAALTRFLGGLLCETKPLDAPTFAAWPDCCLPSAWSPRTSARKAASVSPLEAMNRMRAAC